MKYDLVFVDDSYAQCVERVPREGSVHVESGVTDESMESRRYRIAFLLREVFKGVNDDVLIVDSDVYLPPVSVSMVTSFCIPARAKPGNDLIMFCMSTNLYVPVSFHKFAYKVMDDYIREEVYKRYYVDIWLFSKLVPVVKVVPGTCHYVLGGKYCIDESRSIVRTA